MSNRQIKPQIIAYHAPFSDAACTTITRQRNNYYGNSSIKEIAYRLNFDSPDYFSSKFRSKTGMKPSEFRNQNR